jgi:hypothetical protein
MGWSSGSRVADDLIKALQESVDDDYVREEFYKKMIEIFEDHDCDTLDECVGVDAAFDSAFEEYTDPAIDDWVDDEE